MALATDPRVGERSGRVLQVPALAEEYGFTDLDGTRPTAALAPYPGWPLYDS